MVVGDRLEEVWKARGNVRHGSVPARVDLFVLERVHAALDIGIVVRIARAGHGAQQPGLGERRHSATSQCVDSPPAATADAV